MLILRLLLVGLLATTTPTSMPSTEMNHELSVSLYTRESEIAADQRVQMVVGLSNSGDRKLVVHKHPIVVLVGTNGRNEGVAYDLRMPADDDYVTLLLRVEADQEFTKLDHERGDARWHNGQVQPEALPEGGWLAQPVVLSGNLFHEGTLRIQVLAYRGRRLAAKSNLWTIHVRNP